MNFTKEQFSELLKAELSKNGKKLAMSDRTLNGQVEKIYGRLERANEERELAEVVADYLSDFEEIDGNIRYDNSQFVTQWNKEHQVPKEKETEKKKPIDMTGLDEELFAKVKALEEYVNKTKYDTEVSAKRKEVMAAFAEKGIKDEAWASGYLKKLNITPETDVETEVADALALYNKSLARVTPTPTPGSARGKEEDYSKEFDDVIRSLKSSRGE